jgi:Domain of unknown function (DUF4129)
VKRDGGRPPTIAVIAALFCVVVAIGAGLQGQFVFGGPRWIPGAPALPPAVHTQPPQASTAPTAIPHPSKINPGIIFSWLPIVIIVSLLIIAAIALLVRYWLRHRRAPVGRFLNVEAMLGDAPVDTETAADLPVLHRGLVRAADVLETDREPRDAIVRAWIGLQEAAEDSGLSRRASETPTEFTSRVFESVDADRAAAAALLKVYLRVRFRPAPATDADVALARDAIRRLRETWPVRTSG